MWHVACGAASQRRGVAASRRWHGGGACPSSGPPARRLLASPHETRFKPAPARGSRQPPRTRRLADDPHPAALLVGVPGQGAVRADLPDLGQGRQRRRAGAAQADRRCADAWRRRRAARARSPARAGAGLRRAALVQHRVHRTARTGVCQSDRAGGAAGCAAGLPAPARAVAALSSRTPDRRPHARHRAGDPGNLVSGQLHAVQHPAHPGRNRPGAGLPAAQLRRLVRGHRGRRAECVHPVHHHGHRVAHAIPALDERTRLEGQHPGDRFIAELRNRQVLQQRSIRDTPLRRNPAAL